jgi:hypothetical protein
MLVKGFRRLIDAPAVSDDDWKGVEAAVVSSTVESIEASPESNYSKVITMLKNGVRLIKVFLL